MGPQQDRPAAHANGSTGARRKEAGGNKVVRYRQCQRNHAASTGGHAVDGCREFMASAPEGTAALLCAACGCHRSFHRREVEAYCAAAAAAASSAECDCSAPPTPPAPGDRR